MLSMKTLKQRIGFRLKLNKQGAIIDVDLMIGYLIFISIVVLIINYTLRLTAPFNTNINSLNKEADTLTISEMINNKFSLSNFSDMCNINYTNLRRLTLTYVITGFKMPFIDENISHELLNGSLTLIRNNNELIINAGTNGSPRTIGLKIFSDNPVSITNKSLENNDSFTININDYGGVIIDAEFNVNKSDSDEIIIKPLNGIIGLRVYNVNLSNCFIGSVRISDYCGNKGLTRSTSFNRYALISDNKTIYYAKLKGDAWWTD